VEIHSEKRGRKKKSSQALRLDVTKGEGIPRKTACFLIGKETGLARRKTLNLGRKRNSFWGFDVRCGGTGQSREKRRALCGNATHPVVEVKKTGKNPVQNPIIITSLSRHRENQTGGRRGETVLTKGKVGPEENFFGKEKSTLRCQRKTKLFSIWEPSSFCLGPATERVGKRFGRIPTREVLFQKLRERILPWHKSGKMPEALEIL